MTSVTVNQADVAAVRNMLGDLADKYEPVMVRAINATLKTANTQAAARVGNKANLKAARIKQDFKVKKAYAGNITGSLSALDVWKNRIGLMQYGANQTLKGVTVKIKKDNGRFLIPHAFIAKGRGASISKVDGSVKKHVWWRSGDRSKLPAPKRFPLGKITKRGWKHMPEDYRFPISRRVGPSVAYWFSSPDVFDPVSIQAQHVYLQNVDAKIEDILRRHRG